MQGDATCRVFWRQAPRLSSRGKRAWRERSLHGHGVYLTGNPQITFVDSSGGKKRRSMRGGGGGLMQLVEQQQYGSAGN